MPSRPVDFSRISHLPQQSRKIRKYIDAFLGEDGKEWCGFLVSCFSLFSFFIILLPLSLSAQGGYSAPSFSPWQGSFQGIPRTVPPHRRQSESVLLTHLPHRVPVEASLCTHCSSCSILLSQADLQAYTTVCG